MPQASALIVGIGDDDLEAVLEELDFEVDFVTENEGEVVAMVEAPDLVFAPYSGVRADAPSVTALARRWPGAGMVLLVDPQEFEAGHAAARVVGGEVVTIPLDPRRATEAIQKALDDHRRRGDGNALLERIGDSDPELRAGVQELLRDREAKALALERANQLRSSFISNISHEIRTPITVIQGLLDLLSEDLELDEEQADLIDRVRRSGDNLLTIIQGILDLAKAEAGVLESRPYRVFFPDLVKDLGNNVQALLEARPITFHTDVPREVEWLTIDGTRLRQVLANLLSNAAKFTDEGEIHISARLIGAADVPAVDPQALLRAAQPTGDTLELEIRDTGKGISPELQDRIFDAFQQEDVSSTRHHEGIGIGLAVVREMSKVLSASIDLQSQPGKGTTFRLRMPVTTVEGTAGPVREPGKKASAILNPLAGSRGVLSDLASLCLLSPDTESQAITHALDLLGRLIQPEVTIFAERARGQWKIVDLVGRSEPTLGPGWPPPLAPETLERIRTERRAIREEPTAAAPSAWAAVPVAGGRGETLGMLAFRALPHDEHDADTLKVLQVVGYLLGLQFERARLNRERGEIVASVGRDVKNPLGVLLAYTQVLLRGLRGELGKEQRGVVLRLEQTLHRVILSTLDLLDYQRVTLRGWEVDRRKFSLGAVIDHVLTRQTAPVEIGSFEIRKEVPEDLPLCMGDEIRTDRAFANLFRSIVERCDEGTCVSLRAGAEDEWVTLTIDFEPKDLAPFRESLGPEARPLEVTETVALRVARGWIEAQKGRIELLETEGSPAVQLRLSLPRA